MKFRWKVNEDAEPETLAGRSLGGYRLERLLGRGQRALRHLRKHRQRSGRIVGIQHLRLRRKGRKLGRFLLQSGC